MRIRVYHRCINHIAAVGEANASLTWMLLQAARDGQGRLAMSRCGRRNSREFELLV